MSVSGNWAVTMKSPMGAQAATLSLLEEGGMLSGSMAGPQGEQAFSGGAVDGDSLTFNIEMTQPMPMTIECQAVVSGDSISGTAKLGAFGQATFEGTRQAD
ncbi:MAG: hypothetical protein ISP92_00300 [Pseudomonadales bacterium]|jgi:hypothetical protein|nr:hypothetical protein [Pseudomonadales bacterium]MDA0760003.1 hypothetical protein [Pseudomonadota bacterium]